MHGEVRYKNCDKNVKNYFSIFDNFNNAMC